MFMFLPWAPVAFISHNYLMCFMLYERDPSSSSMLAWGSFSLPKQKTAQRQFLCLRLLLSRKRECHLLFLCIEERDLEVVALSEFK